MNTDPILADLGWSADFDDQLSPDEANSLRPARVTAVHRDRLTALAVGAVLHLDLPPGLPASDVAVGDWVLAEPDIDRVARLMDRRSRISRRAAGEASHEQLIVANVDTVFLVTSCNADFNEARLERFLALAHSGGVPPVILLTKADKTDQVDGYLARARAIARQVPILAINAKDPQAVTALHVWCKPGRTVAFLGTSGVGKSTLISALIGRKLDTGEIREDDAKGRHTTTARELHPLPGGGWLIDTPGMRELRLADTAEGIDAAFSEIVELAQTCRFSNCAHGQEPGCAVQAAIAAGTVDADRLARWQKLKREDVFNTSSMTELRRRARNQGKISKLAQKVKHAKSRFEED